MPTSFLTKTPLSPELAQIMSHAVESSYSLGEQRASQEAAKKFEWQKTEFVQENENLRAQAKLSQDAAKILLGEKQKSVEKTLEFLKDRVDKNRTYLGTHGQNLKDDSRLRIGTQITNDESAYSNITKSFAANPVAFQLPDVSSQSTFNTDYTNYTPEYQRGILADSNKKVADNILSQLQASSANQNFVESGGRAVNPAGISSLSLAAKRNSTNAMKPSKAVDSMGMPLNTVVQRDLQTTTANQPSLWTQYGTLYKQYHGSENGPDKEALGTALIGKEGQLKSNYQKIGQYVLNNANNDEKTVIGKLGLGLNAGSIRTDVDKLRAHSADNSAPALERQVASHLMRGLGFLTNATEGQQAPPNSNLFKYQTEDDDNSGEGLLSKY